MKISEAAKLTGLSVDTVRFYERQGLLPEIHRGTNGHRRFSTETLRWLSLFERLRSTGMPVEEMKRYAHLSALGSATIRERSALLERHQMRLELAQQKVDSCRTLINEKIANYAAMEEGQKKSSIPIGT